MRENTIPNHARVRIIRHVSEKISLTGEDEKFFLSLLMYKSYPRKEKLLNPGQFCTHQYFVVDGCLRVFYLDFNGEEHNAKFAIENWWAFDIESFFESVPAFYGLDCLEPVNLLQLSRENYDLLLEKIPAFERFYKLMLQQSFVSLQHRMVQSLSLTAEERYLRFQHNTRASKTVFL